VASLRADDATKTDFNLFQLMEKTVVQTTFKRRSNGEIIRVARVLSAYYQGIIRVAKRSSADPE